MRIIQWVIKIKIKIKIIECIKLQYFLKMENYEKIAIGNQKQDITDK